MCNRYTSPEEGDIERFWKLSPRTRPLPSWLATVAPLRPAPYVKAGGELEVGQWGMIPPKSETRIPMAKGSATQKPKRLSTNNARVETINTAWTFKFPWAEGKRCLIPAWNYVEPYWGIGNKNIWWRFSRTDGRPWALAGILNEWTDPSTGEVVPNFTMITQNCDEHPLLKLMHKPDRKADPTRPDKRAVVPLEEADWDRWLHGTVEQARALIQLPALELLDHGPEELDRRVALNVETGEGVLLEAAGGLSYASRLHHVASLPPR
jgi:putative SOS response-associated peptidase YedK